MSLILFEFILYVNWFVNILVLFEIRYGIFDFLFIKFYCYVNCCIGFFFILVIRIVLIKVYVYMYF